jgi:hypothetical protein
LDLGGGGYAGHMEKGNEAFKTITIWEKKTKLFIIFHS